MIRSFELENFGPIEALSEDSIGQVNVFIGPNAAGKTFLLKALYTFIRTTLIHIIIQSREQHKAFGFDDTHLDLAKALSFPMRKGKDSEGSEHARERIEQLVGGKMIFDGQSGDWILKNGRFSYPINTASDGLKKISMFEILLGNRYLNRLNDIICWMECRRTPLFRNQSIFTKKK